MVPKYYTLVPHIPITVNLPNPNQTYMHSYSSTKTQQIPTPAGFQSGSTGPVRPFLSSKKRQGTARSAVTWFSGITEAYLARQDRRHNKQIVTSAREWRHPGIVQYIFWLWSIPKVTTACLAAKGGGRGNCQGLSDSVLVLTKGRR